MLHIRSKYLGRYSGLSSSLGALFLTMMIYSSSYWTLGISIDPPPMGMSQI
jgi:hypothetical protein